MAFLDPRAESLAIQQAVTDQLKSMFPFQGRRQQLILKDVYPGDSGDINDVRGQKQAKLRGRTWATPIYADLELRNNEGKVLDTQKGVKLLNLPRLTSRMSYIVEGREVQVSHQWHLRAGAYSRIKDNGELETQFNLAKGRGFSVGFDPKSRKYLMTYGSANVPLHPVLKALDVPDADLEKGWGKAIFDANQTKNGDRELSKLFKAMYGEAPKDRADLVQGIRQVFSETKMYPEINQRTLGAPISKVDGSALLHASKRLLHISRGEATPDNRDALHFKDLWGVQDYLPKRLGDYSKTVSRKLKNNLDRKERIREIVTSDIFNTPVSSFFGTSLAEQTHQVNPIDMISGQRKTTIMGPMGGVASEHAVTLDAKLVDNSHVGFLDVVPTPEGERTGITTFLPIGASKKGLQPVTKMFSTKTGKLEEVSPDKAVDSVIAFPDQYTWAGGKPTPVRKLVKVSGQDNRFEEVSPSKVDYILPSAQGLFTLATNVIPFLQNDSGARANYASKQISQAIALKDREAPFIQVHTGTKDPKLTWEKVLGTAFAPPSPVDGTVIAVGDDYIKVRGKDKQVREVQLYRHYPLNDGKSMIDSIPLVKKGDEVAKGQTLADTSFTKDGTLAYGINARVAYLPFGSRTFEDGVVISESMAGRLTSEHLYQERLFAGRETVTSRSKYRAYFPDRLTDAQAKKLDDDGVIRVGQKVQPGDTLVAALRKRDPSKEQLILQGIHKSLTRHFTDGALVWDHDHPGVVAEVVRHGREIKVHVTTEEPAQVADKMAGRHGNKGVISRIIPDAEMPRDKDGKPMEVILNPLGVGGRVNPGQILETLLGKVAHAKGEPFAVTNFEGNPDRRIVKVKGHWRTVKDTEGKAKEIWVKEHERTYYSEVLRELDEAGLKDREPLYDPLTGEELRDASGEIGVLTGYQYMLKLEHTACYSEDTEILTKSGWKFFRDVREGEEVLSLDPKTEISSYAPVSKTYVYDYNGPMYLKEGSTVSLCVTPNHRLVVQPSATSWRSGWKFRTPEELEKFTSTFVSPTTSLWAGASPVEMRIAGIADERVNKCRREDLIWEFDVFAEFMGWYLSEGSAFKNAKTGYQVQLAQFETSKWFKDLEDFLPKTGLKWAKTYATYGGKHEGRRICTGFVCRDGRLVRYLKQFGHSHDKFVPEEIRHSSAQAIQVFLEAYFKGDGYLDGGTRGRKQCWRVTTASKRMANDLQELAQKSGGCASILHNQVRSEVGWYQVLFKIRTTACVTQGTWVPYSGKVYCVEVPGPGVVYVRRNNKAVWCGNSKGLSARGQGAGLEYDANMGPKGGSGAGGQRIGILGLYAMLAHGEPTALLREMNTVKSDKSQDEFWTALQAGDPLPAPKAPFAYDKFVSYLNALGVNVQKDGHNLYLLPMLDKEILENSNGEIDPSRIVRAKDLLPEKKGLFDEDITGGMGGSGWAHVSLPEPVPNPMFEKAVTTLSGLNLAQYKDVISGKSGVTEAGALAPPEDADYQGGEAIAHLLSKVNVKKDLAKAEEDIRHVTKGKLDELNKKIKYLRTLVRLNATPEEAYLLHNVSVIPPKFRPLGILESGDLNVDDLNGLYKQLGISIGQLKSFPAGLPPEMKNPLRAEIYDAIKSIAGLGGSFNAENKGILDIISGSSPKYGYFAKNLIERKQDLSMRAVVVPGEGLGLDEVGLPRVAAMEMFKPFVVRDLVKLGYSPLEAKEEIEKHSPQAERSLENVVADRPVLLKRDPALHKFSVMAFKPKLIQGKSIQLHPLSTGGFNADFDGDKMSIIGDILLATTPETGYKEGMHTGNIATYRVIDIKDFPHVPETGVTDEQGSTIYDVPPGVYVPAFYEGGFTTLPATQFHIHSSCEEWQVETRNGREILCAQDHSLVLLNPETLVVEKAKPSDALGLCLPTLRGILDSVVTSLPGAVPNAQQARKMLADVPLTMDVGWFIGATIGDGWVSKQNSSGRGVQARSVQFSHGEGGDEVASTWLEVAQVLSNDSGSEVRTTPHTFDGSDCESSKTTVCSTALGLWLEPLIGLKAENKHLPEHFLEFPLECRRGLLAGLIDTDGSSCWSKSGQYALTYHTASQRLAEEVILLGLSLGLPSSRTGYLSEHGTQMVIITFSTRPVQDARWLKLTHVEKQAALSELQGGESIGFGRNDFVPLPEKARDELLQLLRKIGASRKPPQQNKPAFSQYVVLQRGDPTLTRESAHKLAELLQDQERSEYLSKWFKLALDETVGWDLVTSSKPTGETKTMYDLTVPGAWTFTMANGAVVWDSAYVPVTDEAVKEAYKMMPSQNLYNVASGTVMYQPTLESQFGLFEVSRWGDDKGKKFASANELLVAAKQRKIPYEEVVSLEGKKTTAGRVLVDSVLPKSIQGGAFLHDPAGALDKDKLQDLMQTLAHKAPLEFANTIDQIKDIGYAHSYTQGSTITMKDLKPLVGIRDSALAEADRAVAAAMARGVKGDNLDKLKIQAFNKAIDTMSVEAKKFLHKQNNVFFRMTGAGVKPSWDQIRQMILAPVLLQDGYGNTIPVPVRKSYSEGLDVSDYVIAAHGARKGILQKTGEVAEPGALNKKISATLLGMVITADDCETKQGIPLDSTSRDALDRFTAAPIKLNNGTLPPGTLITPEVMSTLRASKTGKILVRSPLRCRAKEGMCAKCFGVLSGGHVPKMRENIGMMAGQSVGERSVQLILKAFHAGGVASSAGKGITGLDRLKQVLNVPETLPGSATLSKTDGVVGVITKDPAGGHRVQVGAENYYVPHDRELTSKRGDSVKKGQTLSTGPVNPRELLGLTGVESVQNYLTSAMEETYKGQGLKRRNFEVVAKAMTNLSTVEDSGEHPEYLRGDVVPSSFASSWNRENPGKKPLKLQPILKGLTMLPLEGQTDWGARMNYQRLKATLQEGAMRGWGSNIHGVSPVPGLMYGAEFGKPPEDKPWAY